MHPVQIISYYPTYALLDQVITNGYKNLNIFIDLKNCAQTLYQKHCIDQLLENSKRTRYLDPSIFQSVLSFLAFHKLYANRRNINISFYIFFEVGHSYYHKNIHNKYKISRMIDDLYGLDKDSVDEFYKLVRSNYLLIEKVLNKVPNTFVFKMENLDADFIPYYILKNKLVDSSKDTANIIYSNDHDLKQSLLDDHCYIFSKARKNKKIIKRSEAVESEIKVKEDDITPEYLPLLMGIVGDNGDDIYGIKGVGYKTLMKTFPQLKSLIGNDMNTLYENIKNDSEIFNMKSGNVSNPTLKKILLEEETNKTITKNIKLISFQLLSECVAFPKNTEMLHKKEQIVNVLNLEKISNKPIVKALEMNGIFLYSDDLDVLYFGSDLYNQE